jgi:Fe2+ or Zn2+ uptake regulation protein
VRVEDERRFQFDYGAPGDHAVIVECTRCGWVTEIEDQETLGDLTDRLDEHTEVCR